MGRILDASPRGTTWCGPGVAWQLGVSWPTVLGERFLIDLESSDFDSYLYVVGPNIRAALGESTEDTYALTDDDGGDALNSRLCFQAPAVATYHVVVGALYAETGAYALTSDARL